MSWRGPALQDEHHELIAMLHNLAIDRDVVLLDDPVTVDGLIAELAELGVWTLGVEEQHGGGGADHATTAVALIQLSRSWPALGVASAQAHAAAGILANEDRCVDLLTRVHRGENAVAVVDANSAAVRLQWREGMLRGQVDRIDAAATAPYLLILMGGHSGLLIEPTSYTASSLLRTGLGGALTRSVEVNAHRADVLAVTGVDAEAARVRLDMGIAAVAAGIAAAAADAAADYAAGRHQFGNALTAIPTVRQSLLRQAEMTSVILANVLAAPDGDRVQSLATLRNACEGAIEVAAMALQTHGGYGYLAEYSVERYLRDAVSLRAVADLGTAAATTASSLVGLPPAERLI